jgi:hypothetical protein
VGFVLDKDRDFSKPGVEAIAECEVDDAIFPAKGNCRLGSMLGERVKTLALPARQHHGENILHCREL